MPNISQAKRRQHIRAAEGYLDLATVLDDRWPLDDPLRDSLVERAKQRLDQIKNPLGHKPYVLFLKGQACRVQNRFEEAIGYLKQSTRIDPENVHALLAMAWCFKRLGQIDKSVETMQAAVELDPESPISHYNLACYCSLNHQVNLALVHLSFALDLNPEYRDKVACESDFDPIRDNPRFISISSVHV
jgi:tetratricopeptide (TPR) repeat protein